MLRFIEEPSRPRMDQRAQETLDMSVDLGRKKGV